MLTLALAVSDSDVGGFRGAHRQWPNRALPYRIHSLQQLRWWWTGGDVRGRRRRGQRRFLRRRDGDRHRRGAACLIAKGRSCSRLLIRRRSSTCRRPRFHDPGRGDRDPRRYVDSGREVGDQGGDGVCVVLADSGTGDLVRSGRLDHRAAAAVASGGASVERLRAPAST